MLKKLREQTKGFTIIEVLIVLAIAGLIMVIVFLAVPSLQRSSRNNQIRNDASIMLGYINEWSSNNNGALPLAVCVGGGPNPNGDVYLSKDATCDTTDTLGGKIRGGIGANQGTANPPAGAIQQLVIGLNRKCVSNQIASTSSNRAFAVGFRIETPSGDDNQCLES